MRMLSPHINNKAMINKNKQCPEFPYFGAIYPDARCIGGYLYDLDDCDEKVMGFPENYKLIGTQAEQKKYIGNAVEVNMARVLCEALARKMNDLNVVAA